MNPTRTLPFVLACALLLGASVPSLARVPTEQLEQVVSSLTVSGTIEVDPQGRVAAYAIEDAQAYDAAVVDLLARNIPGWTFKPVLVDGVARQARFDMYVRLEAKPVGDGRYAVEIASAAFGRKEAAPPKTEIAARRRLEPPRYPADEARNGIGAKVVTVLRIDRDGSVAEAVVEQTDLKAVGREGAMQDWREAFERAALAAAKRWQFDPPTVGEQASKPSWSVRVPVVFTMTRKKRERGEWESVVPGPRHRIPWLSERELADSGVDALPDGHLFPVEQPLQLLTPLNQG